MADTLTSKTFKFELVSPERVLSSEEASLVTIPGGDGDFGVLAGHAPLVSTIRPGVVTVNPPAGDAKKIFVSGGFADVSGTLCTVLAEEAVNVADIDRTAVEQGLKDLQEALLIAGDDEIKKSNLARDIGIAEAKLLTAA